MNRNECNIYLTADFFFIDSELLGPPNFSTGSEDWNSSVPQGNSHEQSSLLQKFSSETSTWRNPVGQFATIRWNCSTEAEFFRQVLDLTHRFHNRGYPQKVISRAFIRAKGTKRETILHPKQRMEDNTLRIVTTYSNQWQDVRGIIQRNWNILTNDT